MAEFYFNCPFCKKDIKADTEWIGQSAECPFCLDTLVIPEPQNTSKKTQLLPKLSVADTGKKDEQPEPETQKNGRKAEDIKEQISKKTIIGATVLFFFCFIVVPSFFYINSKMVENANKKLITDTLLNGMAKYPASSSVEITFYWSKNDSIIVSGNLDLANTYGTKSRYKFDCLGIKTGKDFWGANKIKSKDDLGTISITPPDDADNNNTIYFKPKSNEKTQFPFKLSP